MWNQTCNPCDPSHATISDSYAYNTQGLYPFENNFNLL